MIGDSLGNAIAVSAIADSPDAAYIVRACNAHGALVATLAALTEWGCTYTGPQDANSPHALLIAARAALAQASEAA